MTKMDKFHIKTLCKFDTQASLQFKKGINLFFSVALLSGLGPLTWSRHASPATDRRVVRLPPQVKAPAAPPRDPLREKPC